MFGSLGFRIVFVLFLSRCLYLSANYLKYDMPVVSPHHVQHEFSVVEKYFSSSLLESLLP